MEISKKTRSSELSLINLGKLGGPLVDSAKSVPSVEQLDKEETPLVRVAQECQRVSNDFSVIIFKLQASCKGRI